MTYTDYKQKMGDLIVAGQLAELAHYFATAGQGVAKEQGDIWWAMFVMEHR